jgi:DNA polymerase-3 subunit epsilon
MGIELLEKRSAKKVDRRASSRQALYGMNKQDSRRKLSIHRPLIFIDLETTGSILGLDRIVEVGALKVMPDGQEVEFTYRVNPGMAITPEATKRHGISNVDVAEAPAFVEVGARLLIFLGDSDIAGYNLINFDLPMLQSEFHRVGFKLPMKGRKAIDVMDIFVQKEPRDLNAAYRFYCGREHDGAHSASEDARACWEVLLGQLDKYDDIPPTTKGLSNIIAEYRKKRSLDSGGWFISRYGSPAFARGKYQGKLIREVEELDPDYLDWMLSLGLPEDTIEIIRSVLPDFAR